MGVLLGAQVSRGGGFEKKPALMLVAVGAAVSMGLRTMSFLEEAHLWEVYGGLFLYVFDLIEQVGWSKSPGFYWEVNYKFLKVDITFQGTQQTTFVFKKQIISLTNPVLLTHRGL